MAALCALPGQLLLEMALARLRSLTFGPASFVLGRYLTLRLSTELFGGCAMSFIALANSLRGALFGFPPYRVGILPMAVSFGFQLSAKYVDLCERIPIAFLALG